MAYKEIKIVDGANYTTSTNTAVLETSRSSRGVPADLVLYLNVTAVSGTSPTMDITINGIVDGVAYSMGTFNQVTATGVERKVIEDAPKDIRLDAVLGGTSPDFTFDVVVHRSGANGGGA